MRTNLPSFLQLAVRRDRQPLQGRSLMKRRAKRVPLGAQIEWCRGHNKPRQGASKSVTTLAACSHLSTGVRGMPIYSTQIHTSPQPYPKLIDHNTHVQNCILCLTKFYLTFNFHNMSGLWNWHHTAKYSSHLAWMMEYFIIYSHLHIILLWTWIMLCLIYSVTWRCFQKQKIDINWRLLNVIFFSFFSKVEGRQVSAKA